MLLLHPDGEGVKALVQAIEDRLGRGSAMDPRQNYPGDNVWITTRNVGATLEIPIVFLAGLHELPV